MNKNHIGTLRLIRYFADWALEAISSNEEYTALQNASIEAVRAEISLLKFRAIETIEQLNRNKIENLKNGGVA